MFLLLLYSAASADGNELLTNCKLAEAAITPDGYRHNIADGFEVGYCVGAIHTFKGRIEYIYKQDPPGYQSPKPRNCEIPEGVTNEQLIRVLVKYLEEHPDLLHIWEAGLLDAAFRHAFPCPSD